MRRRVGLASVVGLVGPLVLAATAYGQGATLVVTPSTAKVGDVITVTGSGYTQSNNHIASGLDLRLNTRDAEPLGNTNVSSQGTITIALPVPPGTPLGEHLLIGTQRTVRGRDVFGAPGRAKLRIVAASSSAAAAPGGGLPPAGIVGAVLALIAAGATALGIRRLRMPARPSHADLSR